MAVVITFSFSFGPVVAALSLIDPMVFRPLPYVDADRLVAVSVRGNADGSAYATALDLLRLQEARESFDAVASFAPGLAGTVEGTQHGVFSYAVSRDFFPVLGTRPELGRFFHPDDYVSSERRVAVISHGLWAAAFGQRPDVVGQRLSVRGFVDASIEVIGVLPRDFVFPDHGNSPPAFVTPGAFRPSPKDPRVPRVHPPIARLRQGITTEQATAHADSILRATEREAVALGPGRRAELTPLRDRLFGSLRVVLLLLLGITTGVVLLTAVNLAHLFAAQWMRRRGELMVRGALGASPARLTRLVVLEIGILVAAGGAVSLAVGTWLFGIVLQLTPSRAHAYRLLNPSVDVRVVVAAGLLVLLAAALVAALPVLRISRQRLGDISRTTLGSRTRLGRVQPPALLTGIQAAILVALIVPGSLVVRNFVQAAVRPLGFDPQGLDRVSVIWPGALVRSPVQLFERQRRLAERFSAQMTTPLSVSAGIPGLSMPSRVRRHDAPTSDQSPIVAFPVNRGFFDVFRLTVVRGRVFSDEEAFANRPVAVVDRRTAEWLWPGDDAMGQALVDDSGLTRTVIGIVQELELSPLAQRRTATAFIPVAASTRPFGFHYRGPGGPSLSDARRMVQEIDPEAFVTIGPMESPIVEQLAQSRFLAMIGGTIAALAIGLAGVGLFAVVSDAVSARRREVGIRIALGADGARIRRLIVSEALIPALAGIGVGLVAARWAAEGLRSQLYGLTPSDGPTFAWSALCVLIVVMSASFPPALRAGRVDPIAALRLG